MAVVETRVSVWEALAGRAPGQPLGPADPGLWQAVAERVNPAKARPRLRPGIEEANLTSARGVPYVMLRSPDGRQACYLRLTPEEVELTRLMDGSRTLARLVADFARISGRLAPDQVRRVVADLAGNRMLEELPVDAFRPLERVRRRPWPLRLGRGLLAFAQGRRMVLANIDPLVAALYRAGGRLLFTRAAAALMGTVAVLGLIAFTWQWWAGAQSVFLTADSYFTGAAVLLGLNVLALACHELGHALATKHAGRRVPAAGFLVYFGIPSVFVDTTDVWMAGRRGRIRTTAAGPATGLILAGASALVGLAVPAAAPWCFKLSFAWYVNALFNLNPFLALDGYYLLMDWLEVPNLRARGLAWVAARLRRRPPAWSSLDREGRLVALYGMLAVGWLAIALNIGYRVYADRVGGLVTGLWRSGWTARVLLAVTVAALMSPLVYVAAAWVGRRWRRLRRRLGERRAQRDLPRRLDALRATPLRALPGLADLAAGSRWVYPRTGEQLVFAGAPQAEVFAVVEGALEARAPGDPVGSVRQRVGPGGLVGVGPAIAGTASPLAWYTAGTTLLSIPAAAVARAVGAADGSFGTADEVAAVLAESPAGRGLSPEDRMGLAAAAVPVLLAPGAPVTLNGADDAVLVASGAVTLPDGRELGRGTLIGPSGEERPGTVGTAQTPVRLFSVSATSGLALLLGGASAPGAADLGGEPGRAPVLGVHPPAAYPPLAAPPGPPPPAPPPEADEREYRFERRMRWALVLVLLFASLLTGGNVLLPPLAWAEMPTDKALLQVDRGRVEVTVNGVLIRLDKGDDLYVGQSDDVWVGQRSRARLVFRGGATSILCASTRVGIGALASASGQPVEPAAALQLVLGLALVDTATGSPAFAPLAATWTADAGVAVNQGPAWFAVAPWGVAVSDGVVNLNGAAVAPSGQPLGCGDGDAEVPRPSAAGQPTLTPTPTPSTPTVTPTPTPTPTATPTPTPTSNTTTRTRTTTTTKTKTTTTQPPATTTSASSAPPTSTPPPDTTVPRITGVSAKPTDIWTVSDGLPCNESGPTTSTVYVGASDDHDAVEDLTVQLSYRLRTSQITGPWRAPLVLGYDARLGAFVLNIGPFKEGFTGFYYTSIDVQVNVKDSAGNTPGQPTLTTNLILIRDCSRG